MTISSSDDLWLLLYDTTTALCLFRNWVKFSCWLCHLIVDGRSVRLQVSPFRRSSPVHSVYWRIVRREAIKSQNWNDTHILLPRLCSALHTHSQGEWAGCDNCHSENWIAKGLCALPTRQQLINNCSNFRNCNTYTAHHILLAAVVYSTLVMAPHSKRRFFKGRKRNVAARNMDTTRLCSLYESYLHVLMSA